MPISEDLAGSLKRIETMLDRLEAASERRLRQDQARGDVAMELRLMQDDRSRLALELDQALARNEALANAQAAVSQRLQSVGTSLESLLARADAPAEAFSPEFSPPPASLQSDSSRSPSWPSDSLAENSPAEQNASK